MECPLSADLVTTLQSLAGLLVVVMKRAALVCGVAWRNDAIMSQLSYFDIIPSLQRGLTDTWFIMSPQV